MLKERTINALRRLQQITGEKCGTCPEKGEYRCCDAVFCDLVANGLKRAGLPVPHPTGHKIPFMGNSGCIVKPEHRPGCSGFVCPSQLKSDRKFRREWEHLHKKCVDDPVVEKMMAHPELTGSLRGKC